MAGIISTADGKTYVDGVEVKLYNHKGEPIYIATVAEAVLYKKTGKLVSEELDDIRMSDSIEVTDLLNI